MPRRDHRAAHVVRRRHRGAQRSGADLAQYLERDPRKSRPIDEAIGRWAMKHQRSVAYTWPSLVDHADVVPVIQQRADRQRRDRGRLAWLVGGRQCWATQAVTL
jgi:hypothetical protein